jgi:Reverse transcriptase (RNA-dependent DNA polymerase)
MYTKSLTIDQKIYNFAVRWLFSTNHKCGVLIPFDLGADRSYKNAAIVKSEVAHPKFSKRVKRTPPLDVILSLGKQTSVMTISFSGASSVSSGIICPVHLIILLCGGKGLRMVQGCTDDAGFGAARSEGLGETQYNRDQLKYNYKGGLVNMGVRLGRYGKPASLRDFNRNVVPLSGVKRDFSSGESQESKSLEMYNGKYVSLINVVADVDFLQVAYQKIKYNSGVMVKGFSDEIYDSLDNDWFVKTSERLLNGSFQFMPARRVIIPKPNKLVIRSLTISNFRYKIVQQAMKTVLEQIYDPKFLDTSHGFRPLKGCHSALEMIRLNWTGISWFLKFGIDKYYDTFDRHRMIRMLREEIDDQRFIDLIFKLFNVGVMN